MERSPVFNDSRVKTVLTQSTAICQFLPHPAWCSYPFCLFFYGLKFPVPFKSFRPGSVRAVKDF